jgi:hypothetical protein
MPSSARRQFLDGAVDRITTFSLGENRYRCVLQFREPYVEDRLVKAAVIGAKKTTKFTVERGRDELQIEVIDVKRKPRKNES